MTSGNSQTLPGPQCPCLHRDRLNSPAAPRTRGRGSRLGVSWGPRREAPARDAMEQQHRVGVPPGPGRGWPARRSPGGGCPGQEHRRAGGCRVWAPAGGAWERRTGRRAGTPAPYRRWEARSWAPSAERGRTPGRSAPPTASAGNARREAARGPGGAARPRPASLAPPGRRVGRTLPCPLGAAAPRASVPLVSPRPGSAYGGQTGRTPPRSAPSGRDQWQGCFSPPANQG